VWNTEGTLRLNVTDSNFAANSVVLRPDGSHGDVEAQLTTIDKIVSELGLRAWISSRWISKAPK